MNIDFILKYKLVKLQILIFEKESNTNPNFLKIQKVQIQNKFAILKGYYS